MTKTALTLAAALLASTTLSNVAEAGGIRVGFGFPLGGFVAHSNQNYSSRPSSGYGQTKHCAKPAPRRQVAEEAPVRHVKHSAPKKVEIAEEAPAPRKIKRAAPKVEVADEAPAPRKIQIAKLEDKSVASDAVPAIVVPETPAPVVSDIKGTQSTPAARITTAALEPAAIKDDVKADAPKTEKAEKDKPKATTELPTSVKRLCRRFSAAIAGLIDVPCE